MASLGRTSQDVQDEIDLYTTLLNSLEHTVDQEEDQELYRLRLAQLEEEKKGMGSASSVQHQSRPAPAARKIKDDDGESDDYLRPDWSGTGFTSLKRNRSDYDHDDLGSQHTRKSRRHTPANDNADDSPLLSPTGSIGSSFFDDELFVLSDDAIKDDIREQARRRQQEKEDEQFARDLQASFAQTYNLGTGRKPFVKSERPSLYNQSTFQPNGSFSVPIQSPPSTFVSNRPNSKVESDLPNAVILDGGSDEDDEDIQELSASDWTHLYPATTTMPIRNTYPSSFGNTSSMPGAFSAYGTQGYSSVPGASVYGSQFWKNAIGSVPSWSPFGNTTAGTSRNPFTIDQLESLADIASRNNHAGILPPSWEVPADHAQTQEEIKQLLSNIRPDEELTAAELAVQPQGLKIKLMPHQIKGLAWMTKMEEGSNKGGILADDMGLGKTIQSIAIMLTRRPPSGNAHKPTLIVTPVALMEQWRREMQKLITSSHQFSVTILHGQKAHASWEQVKHFDVIMTSYGTLSAELKRAIRWQEKLKSNPNATRTKTEQCSMLDEHSDFYRVILDEAQYIKNRHTKAAHAAYRLRAEHRWCLSGTPMQNNVEEIFSYIHFCRIRPYCVWDKFAGSIARPIKSKWEGGRGAAMKKLQALLKAILLRRTKKSKIDGQPILQLPEKTTVEERAVFNDDQLAFYTALEAKTQVQFNRYVRSGTVGRNYSKALVLLLRLRQCCCSPQLVTNSADFIVDGGIVEGLDLIENAKQLPENVVTRLKEQENVECPICMDAVDNMMIFNPCGHMVCTEDFSKLVDNVGQDGTSDVRCPHCRANIDTKKITDQVSFNEVYINPPVVKQELKEEEVGTASEDDSDASDTESVSTDGSDDGADMRDFIVNDERPVKSEETEDESDDLDAKPRRLLYTAPGIRTRPEESDDDMKPDPKPLQNHHRTVRRESRKGRKDKKKRKGEKRKQKKKDKEEHKSLAELRRDGLKSAAAKRRYLKQLAKIYEPCAKIDRTLSLLASIRDNDPAEKTIVFSSFTSFLDLVEVPLSRDPELSNYTRYDGSMTARDRNAAVLRFTDDPRCNTILVSLKAGNAGLNLTVANHVILLDPFWNPFVEYQAADRCHRIGQRRPVTVHRVLIGEAGVDYADDEKRRKEAAQEGGEGGHQFTVEDRILALQEKKRVLVEAALDEEGSSSVGRLGVRELGYLFGVNEMPQQNGA